MTEPDFDYRAISRNYPRSTKLERFCDVLSMFNAVAIPILGAGAFAFLIITLAIEFGW